MKQARLAFKQDGHDIGMAGRKRQGQNAVNLDKGAGDGEEEARAFDAAILGSPTQRLTVVGEGVGHWNEQLHAFRAASFRGAAQGAAVFDSGVGDWNEEANAFGKAVRCGEGKGPRVHAMRL